MIKKEINKVCQEWIALITKHEKSLYEWIDNIEEEELDKHKVLDKKLNDELQSLQDTKSKCQGLMSFASMDDLWKPKQADINMDDEKDNIVSLVEKCVAKLDKSLVIPLNNAFDKLKFEPFNAEKVQV